MKLSGTGRRALQSGYSKPVPTAYACTLWTTQGFRTGERIHLPGRPVAVPTVGSRAFSSPDLQQPGPACIAAITIPTASDGVVQPQRVQCGILHQRRSRGTVARPSIS